MKRILLSFKNLVTGINADPDIRDGITCFCSLCIDVCRLNLVFVVFVALSVVINKNDVHFLLYFELPCIVIS